MWFPVLYVLCSLFVVADSYNCYNSKCYGEGDYANISIACDHAYNHCDNTTIGEAVCKSHFDTTGIFCGDQCSCAYSPRGITFCKCPNKYLIIGLVLGIGLTLATVIWVVYFRVTRKRLQEEVYRNKLTSISQQDAEPVPC